MLKIKNSLLALLFLAALTLNACDKPNPVQLDDSSLTGEELSLEKSYGGFDANDEQPAFGDAGMSADYGMNDEDVQDAVAADPAVSAGLDANAVPAYFVRITWGHLQGDSTETNIYDFSGFAEINKGTLAVLKKIHFEPATDYIQRPRDSRTRVDFASQTGPGADGLLLAVIDNDTANAAVEGMLTLQVGGYSKTLTFAELDSLELLEAIDGNGNEISIISRVKDLHRFAGGFFAGRWIKTSENGGRFEGRWINTRGDNSGFLRGIWGVKRNGQHVMFGKYINMNGTFGGLLAGEWGFRGDDRSAGWLAGRWVNRNHDPLGKFKGVWKSGRAGDGRGYFHGRWTLAGNDATD